MTRDKKLLRLMLSDTLNGKWTSSKKMCYAVGWDFRKPLSNIRKMGYEILSYYEYKKGSRHYFHRIISFVGEPTTPAYPNDTAIILSSTIKKALRKLHKNLIK